jgi:hypothetical protein
MYPPLRSSELLFEFKATSLDERTLSYGTVTRRERERDDEENEKGIIAKNKKKRGNAMRQTIISRHLLSQ